MWDSQTTLHQQAVIIGEEYAKKERFKMVR